jgi:hypothetical protein
VSKILALLAEEEIASLVELQATLGALRAREEPPDAAPVGIRRHQGDVVLRQPTIDLMGYFHHRGIRPERHLDRESAALKLERLASHHHSERTEFTEVKTGKSVCVCLYTYGHVCNLCFHVWLMACFHS